MLTLLPKDRYDDSLGGSDLNTQPLDQRRTL